LEVRLKTIVLALSVVALGACSTVPNDPAAPEENASAGASTLSMQRGSYCCATIATANSCDRRPEHQSCASRNDGRVFQFDVP
jgi:hypothetical protein